MIRKISSLLALGVALAAPAQAGNHATKAFNGFGIGANLGYVTSESSVSRLWKLNNQTDKLNLDGRGVIGGIHLDYGHVFSNCWYAGIEGFALFSSLKGHSQNEFMIAFHHSIDLHMEDSYGGALKIGGIIRDVLPYVKVGGVSSRWKATSKANILNNTKESSSKFQGGFLYGLGMDIPLTDRWVAGMEFIHTDYAKFSVTHKDAAGAGIIKYTVRPRQNTFMMKVKFRI